MASLPGSPIAVLGGRFTERHATRLLWRAGFGPSRGQVAELVGLGLDGAVSSLTRPSGPARLIGKPPHDAHGQPLDPFNVWGHDHCWWLDRMVRSDQQLIERMTLIWHSWFATSIEASSAQLMIGQNEMMRARALGNFHDLLVQVTCDPAMLLWLSGTSNTKYSPNENYAREVMELFTLGADRGAYTQRDVHEQARALTGFTYDWSNAGATNFHFDPKLHDPGGQAHLRPPRALQLAGHVPPVRAASVASLVHWSRSCGGTSSARRRPRASAARSSAPTSRAASRCDR